MSTNKKKPVVLDYRVIGKGRFPLDMLRYDACWPESPMDVDRVAEQAEVTAGGIPFHFVIVRVIHLRGVKSPTVERWRRFGWEVSRT